MKINIEKVENTSKSKTSNGVKFTIITPTYNSENYIRDTIESVLSQRGDFEIEYIIADGNSNDSTVQIAREYEHQIEQRTYKINCKKIFMRIFSEKDNGMYDAISKGFRLATGNIGAWINADDTYLPGAFQAVKKTLETFPKIQWLKGKTVFVDEEGNRTGASPCYIFNRNWIQKGVYGRNAYFINQDSVFWNMLLWKKSGQIDSKLKLAGDYDLWIKFSKSADLWSLDAEVSTFRTRKGQMSESESLYQAEQHFICPPEGLDYYKIKTFFWMKAKLGKTFEQIFLKLYPILFWKRKREYVTLDGGQFIIKTISSYRTL